MPNGDSDTGAKMEIRALRVEVETTNKLLGKILDCVRVLVVLAILAFLVGGCTIVRAVVMAPR